MAIQKKHGKGRLDKWYKLAKEKGYRARAAFKLIQLNKKYHILEKSKVLLDLCAAPGSWCQVAAEIMPVQSLIIGVDLAPIKPIPRCITFQSDITTPQCRATIRQHLKTWKADTVLHDGAPNVGTAWVQDAFSQAELVLQSLKLATEFLAPGGSFITKVFRSKDYNALLWVFNQLFAKVEATKPPSSRNVSAEIFVVCRDFKAPKKIDPRFLDPRSVFEELADAKPNNEAKVFNPEKKKRKRDGYEEGDWIQFKEVSASEFIQTTDPIEMLGSLNKLSFEQTPNGDLALATLDRLPETTQEIRNCCADLKVLGRKDFKLLLRWRLKVREIFGFSGKDKSPEPVTAEDEEVAQIEPIDEELEAQKAVQDLKDLTDARKRKLRRRENERKRKDIFRMQMNMTTPSEIGLDQSDQYGDDSVFDLRALERNGAVSQLTKGKMYTTSQQPSESFDDEDKTISSDEEGDGLEEQLDRLYDDYQSRRMQADAKYRAKKARGKQDDDFEGFSNDEETAVSTDDELNEDAMSEASFSSNGDDTPSTLLRNYENPISDKNGLSHRASLFFNQSIFSQLGPIGPSANGRKALEETSEVEAAQSNGLNAQVVKGHAHPDSTIFEEEAADTSSDEEEFEVVKGQEDDNEDWLEGTQRADPMKNGRPDIDIITAEAMTLAHQLAVDPSSRQHLIDDAFNRYSHRDVDGLPDWFLDDENEHSKIQRPVTAKAAAAIKEKMRALNARPIKKVREAKARKKMRAAQRLEKLKKKSALLMEEEMTEGDKAKAIASLMSKASKKKPKRQVQVVVARGGNRGISGRPRGTKGKYKMVDPRMKKDARGLKRAAKKRA